MFGIVAGQNPFLDQFLKRRRELEGGAVTTKRSGSGEKERLTGKGGKSGALGGSALMGNFAKKKEIDLEYICAEKPKVAIVKEYLEKRILEIQ